MRPLLAPDIGLSAKYHTNCEVTRTFFFGAHSFISVTFCASDREYVGDDDNLSSDFFVLEGCNTHLSEVLLLERKT